MYYFIIKKYSQVLTWNLKQNKKKEKNTTIAPVEERVDSTPN